MVADMSSDYFGIPGTIDHSDHNLIDTLTIINNIIEAPNGFGIHICCANDGNCQNMLKNVKISNNTISNTKYVGIQLNAGGMVEKTNKETPPGRFRLTTPMPD